MEDSIIIDNIFNIEEIKNSNLEEIIFMNRNITIHDINILNTVKKLKKIYFIDTKIEYLNELNLDIKSLYFDNCNIEEIIDINKFNLKELFLENQHEIDLNDINIIRNIETLSFTNTKITNEEKLIFMDKIIYLDLFNTRITDLSILINMEYLKVLVIDEELAKSNKEIIKQLIEKGIKVVNDSNQSVVIYFE